jgi:nitrogen-specific signal transduction histidine kinase
MSDPDLHASHPALLSTPGIRGHRPPVASARLRSRLARLELRDDGTPDRESWARLLRTLDQDYAGIEEAARVESERGWTSFENLFRMAPTSIIEQDYTEFEQWLAELREAGVTDLREYFSGGDDIDLIRSVVPKIRISAANPAALRAVGLPLDKLLGPIDPVIVNEGSEPSWMAQFEAVWNGEPEAHASFVADTPDGHTYDAESVLAAPVIDGRPDFSRAVFTVTDVTPHRNEERRMQEAIEGKNRFLAAVSHEIRTPLTAILGFARLLGESDCLEPAERAEMVESIVENSQEMADLVDDLLVAARVESGQVEVAAIVVDVAEQVRHTLAAGGSFTGRLAADVPDGPVPGLADPARFRQIMRNLLTNAERYGGADVRVTVVAAGEEVRVEVSDDGPPLPADEWEAVFEPYHRAHDADGQPESVGIGLAISRQLAELMGGSLRYSHEDGRAVFRLALRSA